MYTCARCGAGYPRQVRICRSCGSDEVLAPRARRAPAEVLHISRVPSDDDVPRIHTGMPGLDELLGGERPGLPDDATVSLIGEPGGGKSTLLTDLACRLAEHGRRVGYIVPEESAVAVKSRAVRLGVDPDAGEDDLPIYLRSTDDTEEAGRIIRAKDLDVVIVDSVNRMRVRRLPSEAGSVQQVLAVTSWANRIAKVEARAFVMVGHVNKEGDAAGPMAFQHDVDACLQLGVDDAGRRYLLATKNRYAPSRQVAYYEMTAEGLVPSPDPSRELLAHTQPEPGVVFLPDASLAQPTLVRVEALVTDPGEGQPGSLNVQGVEAGRVRAALRLLRGLQLPLAGQEIAVEVGSVLGEACKDPGLDLALAVALASAAQHRAVPWPAVVWGRVSVRGRVEATERDYPRLEAARAWRVRHALVPRWARGPSDNRPVQVRRIERMDEIDSWLSSRPLVVSAN